MATETSTEMMALFVGGPWHGRYERLPVQHIRHFKVPLRPNNRMDDLDYDSSPSLSLHALRITVYRGIRYANSGRLCSVVAMVHESITENDAFAVVRRLGMRPAGSRNWMEYEEFTNSRSMIREQGYREGFGKGLTFGLTVGRKTAAIPSQN